MTNVTEGELLVPAPGRTLEVLAALTILLINKPSASTLCERELDELRAAFTLTNDTLRIFYDLESYDEVGPLNEEVSVTAALIAIEHASNQLSCGSLKCEYLLPKLQN